MFNILYNRFFKNKIYFVETKFRKLPKKNYPYEKIYSTNLEELYFSFKNKHKIEFDIAKNTIKFLKKINKEFSNNINFLDFGAGSLKNYFVSALILKKLNYVYYDKFNYFKIYKKFLNKKKINNFFYLRDQKKIDIVNLSSSIQYLNNYQIVLKKIFNLKPKYIFISGLNIYKNNKQKKLIIKQLNVPKKKYYLFFFQFDYFINFFLNNNYKLFYLKKNKTDPKINYNNLPNYDFQYVDIFFKRLK
jgi:putative methyltransferase (TIGR04325 family)